MNAGLIIKSVITVGIGVFALVNTWKKVGKGPHIKYAVISFFCLLAVVGLSIARDYGLESSVRDALWQLFFVAFFIFAIKTILLIYKVQKPEKEQINKNK